MPKILLHPLPIRVFHWVMAVCITILVLTGILFTIEDPAKMQAMFTGYVLKRKLAPSKLSTAGKQLRQP